MPIDPKQRLRSLLIELFQLDKSDLDFGIYRIMNLRAADVQEFIDEILPIKLKEVSERLLSRSKVEADAEAEEAKGELLKLGVSEADSDDEIDAKFSQFGNLVPVFKENYEKYKRAKASAHDAAGVDDLERDIYNDLFRFFDRYYEEGDFVSKPRAGDATFMIPYNGEETKFYWANYDQYYIKTGENFRNYVFTNGETDVKRRVTVEFRLVEAETEVNNNQNKKGRVFIPAGDDYFDWDNNERKLTLTFYYRVPSPEEKEKWGERQNNKTDNKGINERLVFTQLEDLIRGTEDPFLIRLWEKERETKNGKKKSEKLNELYYHLNRYSSINSFDYFIHKDLRKFLQQELDYFLKHEIFSLTFLATDWTEDQTRKAIEQNLIRAVVISDLAERIIEFLSEIENFQKLLYEKKKFVVQSDYCLTLDLIPDIVFDEVINHVLSDPEAKQIKEWQKLGFIENVNVKAKDLKGDRYLVLDTQFLPAALKFKLLSEVEELDESTTGLLVNSDNWQALNLLSTKYKERIKCTYLDPPYNAKSSEIVYKNQYKHSSWISMMESRLLLSRGFATKDGVMVIAIDENEQERLGQLLDGLYPEFEKTCVTIVSNPSGQQGDNFSYTHDYAYFIYPKMKRVISLQVRDEESEDKRNFRDVTGDESLRTSAVNCFYPIFVKEAEIVGFGDVCDDSFHPEGMNIAVDDDTIAIYPIDPQGIERKWRFARQTVEEIKSELEAKFIKKRKVWDIIRIKTQFNYKTVWTDSNYSANNHGTQLLNQIMGKSVFSYPKSIYTVIDCIKAALSDKENAIVLDYFAGSGTTGHAILGLNNSKEDKGNHKYVLAEMGEYFDAVTKARIQKIVYSADWKNGKPVNDNQPLIEDGYRSNGVSHIFQYIKLEQYEDTLNNIQFDASREEVARQFEFAHRIKYVLKHGTKGSSSLLAIERFNRPFAYEMDIIRLNERVPTKIDLIATFNFLLGIDVKRYRTAEYEKRNYYIVEGVKKKQVYLIVWRDYSDDLDQAKERDWIKKADWYDKYALLYANGDNAFGADSIEAEFKRLMFEETNLD